jgi:hypothetical protein
MTDRLGGVYLLAVDYRRLHVNYAGLGAKYCLSFIWTYYIPYNSINASELSICLGYKFKLKIIEMSRCVGGGTPQI